MTRKKKILYCLLDSRAGLAAAEKNITNMNDVDECWDRYILLVDTNKQEICDKANDESYGSNCIITDLSGYIYWEWFATGSWNCKRTEHLQP